MAVLSKYPIDADDVRTFQHFLWKDMPGALLPDDPNTAAPADWYSPEELDVFRLSSKSHWDVPVDGRRQHRARARLAPDAARRSTAPRTATACATTTRSASGPTTCTPGTASRYIYDDAGRDGRARSPASRS